MIAIPKLIRTVCVGLVAFSLTNNVASAKLSWKPSKYFGLNSTWPFRDKDEPQQGTPTRIACTWSDTVMTQPGKPSQRGFGGRIMFYEKEEKKPILVEGQLVVYAFDEAGREVTDNKPNRKYVFPADQIPLHMSKSEMGASYSFFLPWDEAGGPRKEISLVCRFQPTDGPIVTSDSCKQVLPGALQAVAADGTQPPSKLPEGVKSKPVGRTLQSVQTQRNKEHEAQQASYSAAVPADGQTSALNTPLDANGQPVRHMTSTTINLPGTYQMPTAAALANSPQQSTPARQQVQMIPQTMAGQPPVQTGYVVNQTIPTYPQQAAPQQPGLNRTFGGQQLAAGNSLTTQASAYTPSGPSSFGAPPSATYSTTPAGQTPIAQQQIQHTLQQTNLQQQMLQQQMMQQQAMQQRMLQQQMPVQQSTGQLPMQGAGTATVSYPTTGQYR